ncbi:MAG: MFS transporter, partial [Woeseiaceae bacterium]|nr:MFS transporter [Woeseiaceae bacterium]
FVFVLMTAYFILRAPRDSIAAEWTQEEVNWLWTLTFVFSVAAVSLYGWLISLVRFSRIVPSVYIFFSLTFFAFYAGSTALEDPKLVNQSFYVWLSVFSLYHVSVFWSFMSDLFSRQQAPRLFGVIATGASLGAMVGPAIPTFFADDVGSLNLIPVSAVLLLVPVPIIVALQKLKVTELGNEHVHADLSREQHLGRNPFSGFGLFLRNPFLIAIGVFIFMYVIMNTFIYMELRNLLGEYERDARTQIYGGIDLAVTSIAIVTALFVTSRLATRMGMAFTLALIPVLMIGGWLIVAAIPLLSVLIGLQVARRAGNYAITKPGREMLFTLVDSETRYKAKPVIDIVVYRGGDMVTAWFYSLLSVTLGFGLAGIAAIAAVIAAVWAASGVYLGRRYRDHRDEVAATPAAAGASADV